MIVKNYEIENAYLKIKDQNICLFYGENLGLIDDLKKEIKNQNKMTKVINLNQDDVLKSTETFYNDIVNMSLFDEKKIYFINQVNEKLLDFIKDIEEKLDQNVIYLISSLLNKNSKLRHFFEKSKKFSILPCYADDDISIKKIIGKELKEFTNLNYENVNIISEACNKDRLKLHNEIDKIKSCFINKKLETTELKKLLNISFSEDYNELTDEVLKGNRIKINKLLNTTVMEPDKNVFYLQLMNNRLKKLFELMQLAVKSNINQAISTIKPPIFWKDKNTFIELAKKLNKEKIKIILEKTYKLELKIKSNSHVNHSILLKKLYIDICELSNS